MLIAKHITNIVHQNAHCFGDSGQLLAAIESPSKEE
jgi:hypothetical protein